MPERCYSFKYRLFASVDIAGSTAFKQSNDSWVQVFDAFFEDFPSTVVEHHERTQDTRGKPNNALSVWKYVGDEILFVTEIARYEECAIHLQTLLAAMKDYESRLKEKHKQLGLKATAWSGGFPVNNSEVFLSQPDAVDRFLCDYLGPSIDLGFRLTKFADNRRVPVNVELAYLLARSISVVENKFKQHLFYDRSESLKGVIGGKPYPIIWIDRYLGNPTSEDDLLGISRKCDPELVRKFCRDMIDSHSSTMISSTAISVPFIVGDPDEDIARVPDEYEKKRLSLEREDADRSYSEAENATEDIPIQDNEASGLPELPED